MKMHFLGFQVIKEKLMACIIFFVGMERTSRLIIMFFPTVFLLTLIN